MNAARGRDPAERKRQLIAQSAHARKRLAGTLAPLARLEASAQRLAGSGLHLLRQPAALGALALLLALVGPRRVLRGLRWVAVALPLNPVGRRLLPLIGARLAAWLTATPRR